MEIISTNKGNSTILKLKGRLDINSVKVLKNKVSDLLKDNQIFLVVDLQDVYFVDSSGLGCLVACYRLAERASGDIRLSALTDHVRSLIELTRLHRLFDIFEASEDAVRSYENEISAN